MGQAIFSPLSMVDGATTTKTPTESGSSRHSPLTIKRSPWEEAAVDELYQTIQHVLKT
ncbi:MAG: hypothetical protein OJF51_000574 [Nitrospira sp.]|jgi:hypothetical protein|nr:MAG: hypothetical protein OJF51_000574 [Nitrospira sp.]